MRHDDFRELIAMLGFEEADTPKHLLLPVARRLTYFIRRQQPHHLIGVAIIDGSVVDHDVVHVLSELGIDILGSNSEED